jgi:hypothetical protein
VVKIPPQEREQRMARAEFEEAAPAPAFSAPTMSTRIMDKGLPPLPKLPLDQSLPLNANAVITDGIKSLTGTGSGGGGMGGSGFGGGGGGAGGISGLGFFGIADKGSSVVLMLDVSGSMFLRLGESAFDAVRQQAISLIDGLGINTRFGIVIWSGGAGKWQTELVPATDQNKTAAKEFLAAVDGRAYQRLPTLCKDVLREGEGGTRHDLALRQAFTLQPEVIYLLSDGNALKGQTPIPNEELWSLTKDLQKGLVQEARLHTIYFVTGKTKPGERDLIQKLAQRNGGRFKEVEAAKEMKDAKK